MQNTSLLAGAVALGLAFVGLHSSEAAPDCCNNRFAASPVMVSGSPAAYWQGFYVGGHLGADWSDLGGAQTHPLSFQGFPSSFQTGDMSGAGALGGLQLGYNWQSGPCCFVFGIEADIGGMDAGLNARAITVEGTGGNSVTFAPAADVGLYGDITGRAGYAWGHTLFYAKGGIAWFDPGLSVTETIVTASGSTFYGNKSSNSVLTGWTAGAGFETLINPNWSWKIEFEFFDFPNSNNDNGCCFDGAHNFHFLNGDLTVSSVKVGFNYIFNYARPTLK